MLVRSNTLALFFAVTAFDRVNAQSPVQPTVPRELKGVVIDASRAPIPRAEITAASSVNVVGHALTASDGSFNLGSVPVGSLSLTVRQLGYDPKTIELDVGAQQPAALEIILIASATQLKKVVINVADVSPLDEFNEHRRQSRGSAKFYDQEEIRKRGAMYPSDLFRTMPGVSVSQGLTAGNAIRIRGCQPVVWIDGQRVPGAELDEVTNPSDIAGIEFYPSMAGTPAKYAERSARPCGTLLVWTKTR
jgi:hypothetical protein